MLLANFNGKELRHRAVSLRQHGFLVLVYSRHFPKPEPDPKPGFCGLPNPKPGFSKKAPGLESLLTTRQMSNVVYDIMFFEYLMSRHAAQAWSYIAYYFDRNTIYGFPNAELDLCL